MKNLALKERKNQRLLEKENFKNFYKLEVCLNILLFLYNKYVLKLFMYYKTLKIKLFDLNKFKLTIKLNIFIIYLKEEYI